MADIQEPTVPEPTEPVNVDEIKKAIHDLRENLAEFKQGKVDETVIERLKAELKTELAQAMPKHGFQPEDVDDRQAHTLGNLTGEKRIQAMHDRPAKIAAKLFRRDEDEVRELQTRGDNALILSEYLNKPVQDTDYYKSEYRPFVQAMDSATTAEGIEYVPRELSANLIERVALQLKVVPLFPSIQMPTNPFDIPGRAVSRAKLGFTAEQTADTGQTGFGKITAATRKVTLTAKKFDGESLTSKELEEDSLIAILPFIQDELVDYLVADQEDAVINGDTTGTHQDTDTAAGAAGLPQKAWNGLRKLTQSGQKTDASNAALTVAMLRKNRKTMGKYGADPSKLAHILSINAYIEILADASVITLEKYGPQATIFNGELGRVDGSPIIVSEYVRTDLNNVGVNGASGNTFTQALTVYRDGFVYGNRREMTLQVLRELYAEYDQDAIIVSIRKAFVPRFPTTEGIVAMHYDVAL